MTKRELEEVFHIKKEIQDLARRTDESKKTFIGKAKRSSSEFPYNDTYYSVECTEKTAKTYRLERKQKQFKSKLEIKKSEIEDYIETIPFSEIRSIFRFRYIDNKNWVQIAHEMNRLYQQKIYTEDSVRCKHDRYLEKN